MEVSVLARYAARSLVAREVVRQAKQACCAECRFLECQAITCPVSPSICTQV